MIVHEILSDFKTYPKFLSEKLWRLLLPSLKCPAATQEGACHLIGWGTRLRKPKSLPGENVPSVPIKRLRCKTHKKTFSYLPPFLLPQIHYPAAVVNGFVEGYMQGKRLSELVRNYDAPEEKTVRSWIGILLKKAELIKAKVLQLLAKDSYVDDAARFQEQRDTYRDTTRRQKLVGLWAWLKTAAEKLGECRVPFHYALIPDG